MSIGNVAKIPGSPEVVLPDLARRATIASHAEIARHRPRPLTCSRPRPLTCSRLCPLTCSRLCPLNGKLLLVICNSDKFAVNNLALSRPRPAPNARARPHQGHSPEHEGTNARAPARRRRHWPQPEAPLAPAPPPGFERPARSSVGMYLGSITVTPCACGRGLEVRPRT